VDERSVKGKFMKKITITIDGPAGAGKSTVARELAKRLGYNFIDTGAMYRTVGIAASARGIDYKDGARLASMMEKMSIEIRQDDDGQKVFLDGRDVSREIRTPEASMGASAVSSVPEVRAGLLDLQRRMARGGGAVAEGRDTGTVVFPDAGVKFYLDASPGRRARRRFDELREKGMDVNYEKLLSEIIERDRADMTRAVAPLTCPKDAITVDTDGLNAEQVISRLEELVRVKTRI